MTRRLLRYAANGLCLLSLLAAAATAWLWWRAGPGRPPDWVQAAAGPVLVGAGSYGGGVSLAVVGGWNGPPGVCVRPAAARTDPGQRSFTFTAHQWRAWRLGWWEGYAGTGRTLVGPDGRPERVTAAEAFERVRRGPPGGMSPPLREWGIFAVPHWHVLLATSVLPTMWAAGRGRRAWRRRARAGRCAACGYDLRATPDPAGPRLPRCPECGAAAAGTGAAN